ncbi:MAG: hypothetical protein IJ087_13715 [Eggerthellaceae bacterium]|nr:hypothetical protein [Eggerthellaceae bacterium]
MKGRRLIRNRHILPPTEVDPPIPEAREAVARDLGRRLVGYSPKGHASFIRWDAGRSSYGSAFELGANGKPMVAHAVADGQLSLFSVSGSSLWKTLEEGEGDRAPNGFVQCPLCGRSSELDSYTMEITVAFAWSIITISPWMPPFGREDDILGITHRIAPSCYGMHFNLATGKA